MARINNELNGTADDNLRLHFPPERILRLLHGIKSGISLAESRNVSFEDLERLSGRAAGTISSWFQGTRMHQLEFFFALLERVPAALRHELLDATCRIQPTLRHPRLAHDPIAVDRLELLLKQKTGLSIIRGEPKHARGFLFHALGNSAREVSFGQRAVAGLDMDALSVWAPVPGLIPLSPLSDTGPQFQRAWPGITQATDGSLILLGGLWRRVTHLHPEMLQLAQRCHIIIADEFPRPEDLVRRFPGPIHILTVSPAREQPEWLRVTVQGD